MDPTFGEGRRLTDFFLVPFHDELEAPLAAWKARLTRLELNFQYKGVHTACIYFHAKGLYTHIRYSTQEITQQYVELFRRSWLVPVRIESDEYEDHPRFKNSFSVGMTIHAKLSKAQLLGALRISYSSVGGRVDLDFDNSQESIDCSIRTSPTRIADWVGVRYRPFPYELTNYKESSRTRSEYGEPESLAIWCHHCRRNFLATGGEMKRKYTRRVVCLECIQGSLSRAILHSVKDFPTVLIRLCTEYV